MKTHRPRSPIEMMVDRATGHQGPAIVPIALPLRCPGCSRFGYFPALEWMPDDTASVEVECEKCDPALSGRALKLLSKDGTVVAA